MANLGRILFLMPFSRSPAAVGFPERSMHIPDGFLDMKTCAAAGALAAAGVAVALRQARSRLPRQAVPLMGAAGAFVFAAQMLNFPVAGGTSGHLMGGVLCTVLLGPAAAVLVVASVLIVQCLVFADGGVLALGANVLNMAVVPAAVGGLLHRMTTMTKLGVAPRIAVAAVAAWLSTLAAAATCAGELAAAGAAPAHIVFPAMLLVHALIGVGEAAITAMVLIFIARLRPDLLGNVPATQGSFAHTPAHTPARTGSPAAFGLLAAAALALFVSPLASSLPDGLDRIAKNLGFEERAVEAPLVAAPIAEYKWEGPWSDATATSVAGVAGALFTFAVGWSLARLLTNVGRSATTPAPMPALSVAHAAAARPPTVLSWSGSTGAAAARSRRILDPYCDVDSLIHRLPAGVKLLTVVSLSFTLAVVPPSPMLWLCVAWLLGFAATLARLSPGHLLRRLLLLEPLALGVAATALLQPHGVEAFTNLAIRSTLCLLAVVLLSSTTPLAAILAALRRVGMPTILLTVIALMHRYVDVMQDESLRLRRARASRTFAGGRRRTWATLASVLAQLFIRTLQRSQRVFAAMTARGWE